MAAHLTWANGQDGVTVAVQMGLGYPPGTAIASISWTDITAYVRVGTLAFNNGRSDELNAYQAGRLSVTLDNRDRRFDPLHATGPYFGNLKPMVPIRVQMTYAATTVTKWFGYVSGFPQAYDPPRNAWSSIVATDGFSILQRTKLPSVYETVVRADTPSAFYPLTEPSGAAAPLDETGQRADGVYVAPSVLGSALVYDGGGSHAFDGLSTQAFFRDRSYIVAPVTVELWFVCTALGVGLTTMFAMTGVSISMHSDGEVWARVGPGIDSDTYVLPPDATGPYRHTGAGSVVLNQTYHLVVEFLNGLVPPTIYLNAVSVGSTGTFATNPYGVVGWELGANANGGTGSFFAGSISHFAVYSGLLSSGRVTTHYSAGVSPWYGLDTGAVIGLILDMAGWPTADRSIETGLSTVTYVGTNGKTALEMIQAMEATEGGRFFISPAGIATFYNRHHTLDATASLTSQATFGDSVGELQYGDLNLEFDDTNIRNKITTAPVSGASYVVSDTTSIAAYGQREFSIGGLYSSNAGELRDRGNWELAHYKDPATRVPKIVVSPRRAPTTLFPHIRDRQLVDRVTVKRRPQNVGLAISLDVLIEGIEHRFTENLGWTTTYSLSPAETKTFWKIEHPVLGKIGSGNVLAF
jgi:hypothetical protein